MQVDGNKIFIITPKRTTTNTGLMAGWPWHGRLAHAFKKHGRDAHATFNSPSNEPQDREEEPAEYGLEAKRGQRGAGDHETHRVFVVEVAEVLLTPLVDRAG